MSQDKIQWQRTLDGPFILPRAGSAASEAVTTPDVLLSGERCDLYLGAVAASQERIIHVPATLEDFRKRQPLAIPHEAEVALDPGPYAFDKGHVFDPAAVHRGQEVYLYYSAVGLEQDGIGLAVSDDGHRFRKHDAPILTGRSPEVVVKDGRFYLFFVRDDHDQGYAIHLATSDDGYHFEDGGAPVLEAGPDRDWDDFEVTTPRIIQLADAYYMIYAGLNRLGQKDIPTGFGLARSTDLVHWEKYPSNPVFTCGAAGAWDDGAIWFGTPLELDESIFLMYEGGRLENVIGKTPALTQVGLAELTLEDFYKGIGAWVKP